MENILKGNAWKYLLGGGLALLILYFVFKDEVDSNANSLMGRTFDVEPQDLDRDKVLKKGSRGNEVAELQRQMKQQGAELGNYGAAKDGVDGVFGKITEAELVKIKGVNATTLNQFSTPVIDQNNPLTISEFTAQPRPGESITGEMV